MAICAGLTIAVHPAAAASKKQKQPQGSDYRSIRIACLKQVGATVQGGYWYFQGGLGTGQAQAFYDCLDSHTMKSR